MRFYYEAYIWQKIQIFRIQYLVAICKFLVKYTFYSHQIENSQ